MKKAITDILVSTAAVFIGLFLAHFYLRQVGLSRPVSEDRSPLFEGQLIVAQPVSSENVDEAKSIFKLQHLYTRGELQFIPSIEISSLAPDAGLKSLEKILRNNIKGNLLVNVTSYTFNIDKKISSILKDTNSLNRVIIKSPYDNTVRELKRQNPDLIVGSGNGESSRMFILSSLALESLPPLIGEIYFIDLIKRPNDVSQKLFSELRRRNVGVIAEVSDNPSAWQKALSEGVIGIITPSAEKFANWFQTLKL